MTEKETPPGGEPPFHPDEIDDAIDEVPREPVANWRTGTACPLTDALDNILERYGGETDNLVVEHGNRNPRILGWHPPDRCWDEVKYTTTSPGFPSLATTIGDEVALAMRAVKRKPVGMRQRHEGAREVWQEIKERCSVESLATHFDYPRDNMVVYLGLGRGEVLRVSGHRKDFEAGTAVEIIPNEPDYRAAGKMHYPDDEESAKFLDLLNCILPEEGVAEWHRMKWAEALCPFPVRRPDMVSWVGAGGNGKSLLGRGITHAMGDYASFYGKPTAVITDTDEKRQLGDRQLMIGKRIIMIDEIPTHGQLDEAFLKGAVSGSDVNIGGMYQENNSVRLDGKFFLLSNERLRLPKSSDNASARRFSQVQFNQVFDDRRERHGDASLFGMVEREAGGIVRMLINDVKRYLAHYHRSLTAPLPPQSIQAATEQWLTNDVNIEAQLQKFLVPRLTHNAPEMVPGQRRLDDGKPKHSGMAALAAELIEAHDSRRKPTQAVQDFLSLKGAYRHPKKAAYYLELSDEGIAWLLEREGEVDNQSKRNLIYGLCRDKARGRDYYDRQIRRVQEAMRRDEDGEERDPGYVPIHLPDDGEA